MDIPRGKPYLIDVVNTLGIQDWVEYHQNASGGDKTSKEDYVKAIQKYYLIKRYGAIENVPRHMNLALQYLPQKAAPRNQLRPASKQQEIWAEVWHSPDYIVEEKLDGLRFRIIYLRDEGLHCYSRHIDANELLPIEYTNNFFTPFDPDKLDRSITSVMLDSELICHNPEFCTLLSDRGQTADTQLAAVSALMHMNVEDAINIQQGEGAILTPYVFDCLMFNDEIIIDKPLWERKLRVRESIPLLNEAGFQGKEHKAYRLSKEKKHVLFDNILNRGGEGLVAKKINSPYTPDARINDWVKIKRTVGGVLGDSLSGFITGYKPGEPGSGYETMVGSVEVSSNVQLLNGDIEIRPIANVSAFSADLRQRMTQYDSLGYPVLNPEFLGRVMDVDGQSFSSRSKRLVHARFKGWRPDMTEFDCNISEEVIESLIV